MRSYVPRPLHALVLLVALAACTHSDRTSTIKAAIVSVDLARDSFAVYDAGAQARLVDVATSRADALARIADYREQRDKPTGPAGLITAAYRSIAAAAAANDAKSLADMESAITALAAVLQPYLVSIGAAK